MVIGFDGSRAFIKERTGTENYSYQLLKALAKLDKVNKYIVYIRPYTIHWTIVQQIERVNRNFQFKEIGWLRLWTQGGLAFQTFKDKLEVLFVPAHTLPIIRNPGLKTVVTVHDLGVEYLPKMHQLKQQLYLKYITGYQLASATKLIAVSKATKKDLIKKVDIDPKKVSVIYEGYDREKFKSQKSKLSYDLVPSSYFLFVGTVQPRKNLTKLIQAFNQFCHPEGVKRPKDLKLVIVGPKGWLADEIYALPKRLGIENKVKFLGYVPDDKLPALYSGAIGLLFPSLFEGFGLPILEAQACGCPVLTSNTSSMPEVAGKGAIYANPNSVESISNGMIKLLDKDLRLKIKDLGFENIKRFSWEKCARGTLKVLESI